MNDIGQKIRQRRIELGYTQDELAQKVGYKSRASINKLEKERDMPINKLKPIADALDVDIKWLMGWDTPDDIIYNRDTGKLINEIMNDFKLRNFIEMYLWLDDAQKDAVFNLISSMYSKDS